MLIAFDITTAEPHSTGAGDSMIRVAQFEIRRSWEGWPSAARAEKGICKLTPSIITSSCSISERVTLLIPERTKNEIAAVRVRCK
ncbi:hypothetical protein EVAR_36287_1 [Eumeta japonica]|uniref:Uncharacterized protein n=1 Tax=Eumeta variegata TaxID=151549 RepID=A0A4C1VKT2_EUMVA|nr:hypothetical protein EVAR_36287_1 [Eumeta japonica]